MISVKDKTADKESMKERFGGEGGPSFLYEDGRVKAVRKTLHRSLLSIYCALMDTDCPSLPKVLSIEATAKSLTVVEEYIPGRTLQQVIDQRQGAEEEAVFAMGRDICAALQVIHSMTPPVIHRDIKPSNIILSDSGRYVLIDFDASRRFAEEAAEDTVLLGTFGYAAPEQYGFSQTDARSDIFSLGATMYEYRTGLPYRKNADVPGRLGDIISKCTRFDPKDRYQSAGELARALEGMEDGVKKKKHWPVFAVAAAALLCAALISSLNKSPVTEAAANSAGKTTVNASPDAAPAAASASPVIYGMVAGVPDGLNDYITTEDGMVKLRVVWNGTDQNRIKVSADGSDISIRIAEPLQDEDWLPINEERDLLCPTLRMRIMTALPDDPNVVSYHKRITQDEDENYNNGVYSVFNKDGVRIYSVGDNFPYEMYRYENGKGVFRRYDYQWLDKDGNVVGEDSFSVTVSLDEGII